MREPTPSKQEREERLKEKFALFLQDDLYTPPKSLTLRIKDVTEFWLAVLEDEREAIYKEIRNRILEDVHWAEKLPAFIGNKLNQ